VSQRQLGVKTQWGRIRVPDELTHDPPSSSGSIANAFTHCSPSALGKQEGMELVLMEIATVYVFRCRSAIAAGTEAMLSVGPPSRLLSRRPTHPRQDSPRPTSPCPIALASRQFIVTPFIRSFLVSQVSFTSQHHTPPARYDLQQLAATSQRAHVGRRYDTSQCYETQFQILFLFSPKCEFFLS